MATDLQQASPNPPGFGMSTSGDATPGIKSEHDVTMADTNAQATAPTPNISAPPLPPNASTTPTNSSTAMPRAPPPQESALESVMPAKAAAHGAPTRQFLNERVTSHLLEGMKHLALHRPQDPLRYLGEFLLERSKQVEGQGNGLNNNQSTNAGSI